MPTSHLVKPPSVRTQGVANADFIDEQIAEGRHAADRFNAGSAKRPAGVVGELQGDERRIARDQVPELIVNLHGDRRTECLAGNRIGWLLDEGQMGGRRR